MTLHREGTTIMLGTLLILIAINTGVWFAFSNTLLSNSLLVISLVFLFLIVQFFRIPKRTATLGDDLVVSPCDGKVVVIEEVFEPEVLQAKAIQVSIFMSPINVHANWFPISGTVSYDKYHPGKFLVAWHPKSSTENERTTICVDHASGARVVFRQIAGALAKRIKYYCRQGQTAQQAAEFGFIKFGSRVDLYLPLGTEILVDLNQKVSGQITQIARLKA
ncbi:MAG TPA: phosphatidylserine decarboxylase family protein [Luteibaculaceae bacterium]|nr:phosphatidylserine decarboxylase family protein [Luteibaculaceae bacterium]